jgi:hypothetical protein
MMTPWVLSALVAFAVLALHLQQVPLLSGSLREFWTRTDENAKISKVLFGLSLCACLLIVFLPVLGIFSAVALMALSLGFCMKEWKN